MGYSYRRPPLSSHRLFPVIVAVWFAALFGLGCLVLPAVLLERAANASRIANLLPAAAPPLGMTARIALASAATVFGALLGFAIARRVAAAQAPAPPVSFDQLLRPGEDAQEECVRRPISASEELGAERFDAPVEVPAGEPAATPSSLARKRRLALPEDPEPEPEPFAPADPLSGHAPPWADEHPLMPSAAAIAEKAMVLHGHDQTQPASEAVAEPEPEMRPSDEPASPVFGQAEEAEPEPAAPPAPQIFAEPAAAFAAEHTDEPAPALSDPASSEPPLAFAAPSQAKPAAPVRSRSALAEPLRALLAGKIAPVDKVGGPLDHLGTAELAERLARSLQNFDSKLPSPAPAAIPQPDAPPASPADFAPPPPVLPDALRPFAPELEEFGEDEDEDAFDFPFAASAPVEDPIPPGAAVGHPPESENEDADEPVEEFDATGYGSLLSMTGAARPFDAPPHAERQPAGPRGPLDPAETERALRSALATLQRMSGTA